jgi:hypothetical protein
MSSALEAAIVIPVVVLLVLALLFSAPPAYRRTERAARDAVSATDAGGDSAPSGLVRAIMAATDSASLLSGWIPGLGPALGALGGTDSPGGGRDAQASPVDR